MLGKKVFGFGTHATTHKEHIIFDKETGVVRYDDDGTGGHHAHIVTVLDDVSDPAAWRHPGDLRCRPNRPTPASDAGLPRSVDAIAASLTQIGLSGSTSSVCSLCRVGRASNKDSDP